MTNLDKYKDDIKQLLKTGDLIFKKIKDYKSLTQLRRDYETWYSESYAVIKVVLSDRAVDFSKLYHDEKAKNGLKHSFQHVPDHIDSWNGPGIINVAKARLDQQIGILKSCQKRFESSLFDIKQVLQADLFDSELEAAQELNKKGFTRGAGAIAGVVLEGHLMQVCLNHQIKVLKKNPAINDLNQLLKDGDIIEMHTWRTIQYLGDLRNLCDHKKPKEPTKEDIDKLIKGVSEISKTVF